MNNGDKPPELRINRISLGPFERLVLPWMAKRLPGWITPDMLTILGLLAALLVGASYWLTQYSLNWLWMANFGLVLHWWADSLDGTLARVRHIERDRYGFFVDHYSDTITVFLVCFGMGISPIIDFWISLLLIISYNSLAILVYLVSMTRGVFKISFAGMGPTEIRMIIIITNTIIWFSRNPLIKVYHTEMTIFDIVGLTCAIILIAYYLIFGEIERRKLSIVDPPRSAKIRDSE